jgi:hypothetical protein
LDSRSPSIELPGGQMAENSPPGVRIVGFARSRQTLIVRCGLLVPLLYMSPVNRRFLNTGGIIENHRGQTTIRLSRRTYSPVLRQASMPETITIRWWDGRTLRYQYDRPDWGPIRLLKSALIARASHCPRRPCAYNGLAGTRRWPKRS